MCVCSYLRDILQTRLTHSICYLHLVQLTVWRGCISHPLRIRFLVGWIGFLVLRPSTSNQTCPLYFPYTPTSYRQRRMYSTASYKNNPQPYPLALRGFWRVHHDQVCSLVYHRRYLPYTLCVYALLYHDRG